MTVELSTRERGLLKGAYEQVKCACAFTRACVYVSVCRKRFLEGLFAKTFSPGAPVISFKNQKPAQWSSLYLLFVKLGRRKKIEKN